MSKTTTHVLVPHTNMAACGIVRPYKTAAYRNTVTCRECKRTKEYKGLPWYKERRINS